MVEKYGKKRKFTTVPSKEMIFTPLILKSNEVYGSILQSKL